jgi:RNA polymerase sigma factor for flagellar operon FliA
MRPRTRGGNPEDGRAASEPPRGRPSEHIAPDGMPSELARLWEAYKLHHDEMARQQLILYYAPLVKYVASRVASGMPRSVDRADIYSYGVIGLIDALEKFDLGKHVRFETYALARIKGAIVDQLRAFDWVPRSVRSKLRSFEAALERLEKSLGREPTLEELARELQVSQEEVVHLYEHAASTALVGLEQYLGPLVEGKGFRAIDILADSDQSAAGRMEQAETQAEIQEALRALPERERRVVQLYYLEGLSLQQVGKVLGVTESRACQLHRQAVLRLKETLKKRGVLPESA